MQLDDLTVLDFTHLLPGPYATQLLADLGAEVIKIEPPDGDGARHLQLGDGDPGALFSTVNRGKKSIQLDLKAEGATPVLERLFADADVVIEQFRPGVADRLGVGYDDVTDHSPEVVYCSLTGYGQEGPDRDRVGHDLNYVGTAGILDMTREDRDAPPVIPGVPIADMAGGMFATLCILGGLLSREFGAGGEHVDVSMTDVTLSLGQVLAAGALFGNSPAPGETLLTGQQPCYGVYETADGRYITIAAIEPKFWEQLCEALDRPDLVDAHMTDEEATRKTVREELEAAFASRPAAEWEEYLGDRDVMFGLVNTFEEALDRTRLGTRNVVESGSGPPRIGFPAQTTGTLAEPDSPPPALGEHTDAVLQQLGFDDEDRRTLHDQNIVG